MPATPVPSDHDPHRHETPRDDPPEPASDGNADRAGPDPAATEGGDGAGSGRVRGPVAAGSATVADALVRLEQAAATLRRWDTPLESALLAVVDRRFTDEVDTVAVQLRQDGVTQLLANPTFVCDLDVDDVAFVLCHEALHLLFNHLVVARGSDRAWQMACEVVINHWVQRHTGRPLPRSRSCGRPLGVDPFSGQNGDAHSGAPVDRVGG